MSYFAESKNRSCDLGKSKPVSGNRTVIAIENGIFSSVEICP